MRNFFTEIERCFRLGVCSICCGTCGIAPKGYREVIRVREDGKVEVQSDGQSVVLDGARAVARPAGPAPQLTVTLAAQGDEKAIEITALAKVVETTAPVYYTHGADTEGVITMPWWLGNSTVRR